MQKQQANQKQTTQNNKEDNVKALDRELSEEERVMKAQISAVEKNSLQKVFDLLCGKHSIQENNGNKDYNNKDSKEQTKDHQTKDYFTEKDIVRILNDLDYTGTKQEIDQMIWEVDDNLNGKIDQYEFELMYKRCSYDRSGLEPKSLYNFVQFLMFLQKNTQADDQKLKKTKKTITSEDTLELLYVRHGRSKLDQEIEEIFGRDNMGQDGQDKEVSLSEYLLKIKKKDFKFRKAMEKKRQDVNPDKKDRNDDYYYKNI